MGCRLAFRDVLAAKAATARERLLPLSVRLDTDAACL
jgi:hypothetical protein